MSQQRKNALITLIEHSHLPVLLITPDNLHQYTDKPIHKAFPYLSETHKADYLRTHFMNYHGGGYSDIKGTTASWVPSFNKLEKEDKWICGYKELPEYSIHNGGIIGNCSYICKPYTQFTKEWYSTMSLLLDSKYHLLKKHPATHPQQGYEPEGYPLEWEEMLGNIFHKVCNKYKDKILDTLPCNVFTDYR